MSLGGFVEQLLANAVITLLPAVVGGYVGFRGALNVHNREQREKQIAAGRALFVEVYSNYNGTQELADQLMKEDPVYWCSDFERDNYYAKTVWNDTLPTISPLLNWDELEQLVNAYSLFDEALQEIERLTKEMRTVRRDSNWAEPCRQPLQRISGNSVGRALHGFMAAAQLLGPKVLTKKERRNISTLFGQETASPWRTWLASLGS
jgi:hypothetical protein